MGTYLEEVNRHAASRPCDTCLRSVWIAVERLQLAHSAVGKVVILLA